MYFFYKLLHCLVQFQYLFDVNCIFEYSKNEQKCSNFVEQLKKCSILVFNNELCFDLFRQVNSKEINSFLIKNEDSLYQLSLDNKVKIINKINVCSLNIKKIIWL